MTVNGSFKDQILKLKEEHGLLDETITRLGDSPQPDQFAIQRLKKKKLYLKDKILRLEMESLPNIIA